MTENNKHIRYYKWLDSKSTGAFGLGLGPILQDSVLLLTTIACDTGLPCMTSLHYDEIHHILYALAEPHAKTVRNIKENPEVRVQRGEAEFTGVAITNEDILDIADLLEYRLEKYQNAMIAYLCKQGYFYPFSRMVLEHAAQNLSMVTIQPMMG